MDPEPLDIGNARLSVYLGHGPGTERARVPGNYLPYSFTGTVSEHRSKDNMVKARFAKVVFSVYVLTGAMFEMARHASSWTRHNVPILGPTNPPFSR